MLREYKICHSCMRNNFSSSDNKLCKVVIPMNLSGDDNNATKKCYKKRVGNYESNSTSFDFDKNKFETPVERAKEVANIIRDKSSTCDLHGILEFIMKHRHVVLEMTT